MLILLYSTLQPTHDRQWSIAQQNLPHAIIDGDQVEILNIRSFRYGPVNETQTYSDQYDLNQLESVWFGVDRFTDFEPMAHTFLSFGFAPGNHRTNYLAFSVETRREKSEEMYSPLRGIYKNYEMIYVIADEQDVLSVRLGRSPARGSALSGQSDKGTSEGVVSGYVTSSQFDSRNT